MSHHHGEQGGWDQQAAQYDKVMALLEPALGEVTTALLDAVGAGPGVRLLDLACGPGHTTAAAAKRGASALGIDLSAQMVSAARKRFPHVSFQVGDVLAAPPGPWDAVVCRFGVHHVDASWAKAIWGAIRPGGRLAVAELDGAGADAQSKGMRSPDHWAQLMRAAGFVDVTLAAHRLDVPSFAARDPALRDLVAQGEAQQFAGPAFIVSGRRPAPGPA